MIFRRRRYVSPDGGQYRIEIPSVEGPNALRAVFETADAMGVPIHRVSQGSGVMLLTDDELDEMAALGRGRGIEVSLFIGPRAGWDTGAMAYSAAGKVIAPKTRGMDQTGLHRRRGQARDRAWNRQRSGHG